MKLTRIAARSAFVLSMLTVFLLAGCGQRRVYYPVGYGAPPPVVVIHHYGGYGGGYGYGGPPTVVHVYHHGGYGGFGGHTVIVHHHY